MIDRDRLAEVWRQYASRIVGALIGFLIGLFLMWVGLFWTLVIALLTFLGYWVGARADAVGRDVPEWLERLLPTGRR